MTDRADCTVVVPPDLSFFAGHFEGRPVLAGVAQIDGLVLELVERTFGDIGALAGCSRIKFHQPIGPGDELRVSIERTPTTPGTIAFEITRGDESCSRGRLHFKERSP